MRSTVIVLALLMVLTVGPGTVIAQSATPTADESPLAATGYLALRVIVSDDAIETPDSVPAGRTLITLNNAGTESWHGLFLRMPDEMTADDLMAELEAETNAPPAFLFTSTYPGFPGEVLPGQTTTAVVDLIPGRYAIIEDDVRFIEVVAGDDVTPAVPPAPKADAVVRLFEYGYQIPDEISAGPQIWEVINTGREPHELLLASVPRPVTVDEVLMAFEEEESGSPTPGALSVQDFQPVGGLGWLSQGQTAWAAVNLAPGTYVALCFVPDETGTPHVLMGMIAVFTVQ